MKALREMKQWKDNYSDEHRDIALKCAKYYDAQYPRYYGRLVDTVLSSPHGHILDQSEFNKMCKNKYAKRVLAAYF